MTTQPAARGFHPGSILQIALAVLGFGSGLLGAAGLLVVGLLAGRNPTLAEANSDVLIAWAWAGLFLCLPAIPSAYYSVLRLLGKPAPARNGGKGLARAGLALLLFPLALGVGAWTAGKPILNTVVFPLAAILVACLPIWFAVELARRGAQAGGPQRQWGVFNFALYFSTPLVFVLEIIGFILLVVGVAVWASTDPQRLAMIQRFQQDLLQAGGDIQSIQSLYLPLLRQPWILFGIYAGLALLIPLLEEFIKPLALWFLIGRDLDPASGLALGAIAGAGFALPETLLNLAGSAANPEWLGLAIGRFGTSLLHVATTALTGMAIASAWRSRRFHWLFLAFTLSCGLHGLWNGLTITSGLAPLLIPEPLSRGVVIASMGGLVLLAVGFVSLLIILNRRLRPVSHPDVQPGVENT